MAAWHGSTRAPSVIRGHSKTNRVASEPWRNRIIVPVQQQRSFRAQVTTKVRPDSVSEKMLAKLLAGSQRLEDRKQRVSK